ncbi:hypothetical protein OH77DRAFT_33739 [Trametes cingulata]|nr:hypothetical protein OH77DRAFT_33739 [Trametes cingulata]
MRRCPVARHAILGVLHLCCGHPPWNTDTRVCTLRLLAQALRQGFTKLCRRLRFPAADEALAIALSRPTLLPPCHLGPPAQHVVGRPAISLDPDSLPVPTAQPRPRSLPSKLCAHAGCMCAARLCIAYHCCSSHALSRSVSPCVSAPLRVAQSYSAVCPPARRPLCGRLYAQVRKPLACSRLRQRRSSGHVWLSVYNTRTMLWRPLARSCLHYWCHRRVSFVWPDWLFCGILVPCSVQRPITPRCLATFSRKGRPSALWHCGPAAQLRCIRCPDILSSSAL